MIVSQIKKEIKSIFDKGFFHLLTSNYIINIVMFGSQMIVAWILTPEDLGRIKIMQSYIGIATIFSGLGFNTSTLKLVSEKRPIEEKRFIFKKALSFLSITLIITFIILLLFSRFNLISEDILINKYFPLYLIILIPMTLNTLIMAYLQALKRIKLIAKIQTYSKFINIIFILSFTYYYYLTGYIFALILGFCITSIILFIQIKDDLKSTNKVHLDHPFKIHWQYAKFSFLANGLSRIGMFADIFLINYLILDRVAIGYYSFALTLIQGLRVITATIQQISTPYFSEKSSDFTGWKSMYKKYNIRLQLVSVVVALLALFFVPEIIQIIFKGKYNQSIPFFNILIISWVIRNLYSLKGVALLGLGKINLNFYSSLFSLPVAFIVTYYLINKFGIMGAAYGGIASALAMFLFTSFMFQRVIKNRIDK